MVGGKYCPETPRSRTKFGELAFSYAGMRGTHCPGTCAISDSLVLENSSKCIILAFNVCYFFVFTDYGMHLHSWCSRRATKY